LTTLRTLGQCRILDRVLAAFQVQITPEDRNHVQAELQGFHEQERIQESHADLWKSVREDGRFVQKRMVAPPVREGETEGLGHRIALSAWFLAQQSGTPLLADDRVLQALMLNDRSKDPRASFGTDRLLLALRDAELLTDEQVADAFLKLIRWRYRFIVLPPEVLKTLALQFTAHPPGEDLRDVALYVHDCMRDAGLFSGFEPTDPPTTIAVRLFRTWITNAAEFIMDVWADERFSDECARKLTEWAIQEFLPSPPRGMQPINPMVGSLSTEMALTHAMLRSCRLSDVSRAHAGLRAIAAAFGMSELVYVKKVTEVIDGF
jgi:hypothetical protein